MKRAIGIFVVFIAIAIVFSWNRPSPSENVTHQSSLSSSPLVRRHQSSTVPAHSPNVATKDSPAPRGPTASKPQSGFDKAEAPTPARPDTPTEIRRHQEFLSSFRTGRRLELAGRSYEILKLKAVPRDEYRSGMGDAVLERFGFVFFAREDSRLTLQAGLPVVLNPSNGILGVITGTVIATIRSANEARAVAATHNLELKSVDESVKLVYLGAHNDQSLGEVVARLEEDPSVQNVTLEVVQSRKRF